MTLSLLLEMAAAGSDPERAAVVSDGRSVTTTELDTWATRAAGFLRGSHIRHVAYVGTGGLAMPLLLFGCARAGLPFTPVNYRLGAAAVRELVERLPDPLVVADAEYAEVVRGAGKQVVDTAVFLSLTRVHSQPPEPAAPDPEDVAVVLCTSGTTARPKAVQLTHGNLTEYVMGTVDFASAEPGDAMLICVPPYHIAGVGAALTNLYAGRTMVYLPRFDPGEWIRLVREQAVTNATVVPTMLDRIVTRLSTAPADLPTLRTLAYGGAKASLPLVRRTMELLPHVGLVNAYGLTETSSTIAVLTPEDHRTAATATDPAVARRLRSVGRAVPGVELQIRDAAGNPLGPGVPGELYVRGRQVSGRYEELGSTLDAEGWFPTKDLAEIDAEGYLFLGGRADDTIIRGGENIAPAELEDVLVEHPAVREVAVVGAPDPEWGQIIVAVVVPAPDSEPDPEALRDHVRSVLRGSRTPDRVVFRTELPVTATGKVLRRELVADLTPADAEETV